MSSNMVVHKANAHVDPCGLGGLVDEFEEEEEEGNQTPRSAAGEEPQLEIRASLDEDSDTTQGSILFPKIEFFINGDIWGLSFL